MFSTIRRLNGRAMVDVLTCLAGYPKDPFGQAYPAIFQQITGLLHVDPGEEKPMHLIAIDF